MDVDEIRWMGALQARAMPVAGAARILSTIGEHSAGWLALGAVAAALDPARRSDWTRAGLSALSAHAAAVVIKRVVRRPRPDGTRVQVLVSTPSGLSFPSAHTASTTAMAVASAPMLGAGFPATVALAQVFGRVVLGVHYPTDVFAGAVLGAGVAVALRHVAMPHVARRADLAA